MMPAKRKQTGRTKKTERLSLAPLTPEDALKKMLARRSKRHRKR